MADPDIPPPPLPPEARLVERRELRRSLRFSLKTLLQITASIAAACGAAVLLPAAFSQLAVGAIWLAASGWIATGLVFGRGDQRAFCIGAALVVTSMWTGLGGRFMQGMHDALRLLGADVGLGLLVWLDVVVLGLAAVANGLACVQARRYFQSA